MAKKRIVTFVCEVEQPAANWLWDTHLSGKFVNGLHAIGVNEGDVMAERDEAYKEIEAKDLELETV